jgi:hypothetical protein
MSLFSKGKHDPSTSTPQSGLSANARTAATLETMVPNDQTLIPDAVDLLNKCRAEFVAIITGEAQEIAEHEDQTIIAPEHFLQALKDLGFDEHRDVVEEAAEEAAKQQVCHPIPTRVCALVKMTADEVRRPTRTTRSAS